MKQSLLPHGNVDGNRMLGKSPVVGLWAMEGMGEKSRVYRVIRNLGLLHALFWVCNASPVLADVTWKVAAGRSSIGFTVKHFVLMNVKGQFREYEGVVVTPSPDDFSHAKVDVKIPVSSIYTGNQDRDDHLKHPEFFDADQHPNIRFVSTKVVALGEEQYEMHGMLTIRGVSKPVKLKVVRKDQKTLANGTKRLNFVASGAVNRYDFGLRWNELTEAGGMVVDETVNISIEVSLLSTAGGVQTAHNDTGL